MKHDMPDLPLKKLKHIDIQFTGDLHRDKQSDSHQQLDAKQQPVASDAAQRDILKFVEAMGGFEAARAAITTVENSLRRLMK